MSVFVTIEEATRQVRDICLSHGASEAVAESLACATVAAEACGQTSLGFVHLQDYLSGFASGRIDPRAEPSVDSPALALIQSDARRGIAQLGFDRAFADLRQRAEDYGIALFAQHNGFTCGELGYFARRLASSGLVAFAATNGPALVTVPGSGKAVYSTNPFAFAAPSGNGSVMLIDQASSATAFVNIRQAAEQGAEIPLGWAVDINGQPTTDARAALKGALLTFGGARGANLALMIEVLAAGVTGANWSLDAPDFTAGSDSPGSGLLVIAIAPRLMAADFEARLALQLTRLETMGVHVPGRRKEACERSSRGDGIAMPDEWMS